MSKKNIKIVANSIIIALVIFVIVYVFKNNNFKNLSPVEITAVINSYGVFGPIVYIIMFTLVPLTLFPDAILAIAAGLTFGLIKGTIFTILGALSGATMSFYLSRYFGKEFISKLIKKDICIPGFDASNRGFLIILMLRLIPLLPFDVISYGAGLSKVKYKAFIIATCIGIIPGVVIYTNIGDKSSNPFSLDFVVSILLLFAILAFSLYFKKKYNSRFQKNM
jgi:uncharacterized membrane protein YdjX (TVP38/TMEM64 family)